VTAVGVDGCGAPLYALPVSGLARAFRSMVLSDQGSPERAVADAMRTYPDWTSGSTRPERALMDAVPGLMLKSGAEGVEAFALADGRAGAFKIDDGGGRARPPVTVALLRALGAAAEPGVDGDALERVALAEVTGGGERVGEIRVVLGRR
jgi:L-asparaginase II